MTDRELYEHIDVEEMLNELGLRNVRNTYSGGVEFSCPFPGHSGMDSNPSVSMSTEENEIPDKPGEFYPKTSFYCFTCGMKGSAITFLAEYEGISPIQAKRFLIERFAPGEVEGVPRGSLLDAINKILEEKNRPTRKVRAITILDWEELENRELDWPKIYCEWEQTHNSPYPFNYMLDRGFEPETLMDFHVGFDPISQRFSIPAFDPDGNLVGFKGRAWWEDAHPKYIALGGAKHGFEPYEVSRILWGLHIAKKASSRGYEMIIREGELNAMMMHQIGLSQTVGVSGKRLSRGQVELVKGYADRAVVYFDEINDSVEAASKLRPFMPVRIAWTPKDPCDSQPNEVFDAVQNAEGSLVMDIRGF